MINPVALIAIIFLIIVIIILVMLIILGRKSKGKDKNARKHISYYICRDGHHGRTQGEMIIDNELYYLGLKHKTEDYIDKNKVNYKYDWYLPEYDVYIEYFGYWTDEYKKQRKLKEEFYQKNGLKLVAIEPEDLSEPHKRIPQLLAPFVDGLSYGRHCPHCGKGLDSRM